MAPTVSCRMAIEHAGENHVGERHLDPVLADREVRLADPRQVGVDTAGTDAIGAQVQRQRHGKVHRGRPERLIVRGVVQPL